MHTWYCPNNHTWYSPNVHLWYCPNKHIWYSPNMHLWYCPNMHTWYCPNILNYFLNYSVRLLKCRNSKIKNSYTQLKLDILQKVTRTGSNIFKNTEHAVICNQHKNVTERKNSMQQLKKNNFL